MKLTKQECEVILKAVELIDTGKYVYACSALDGAELRLRRALTLSFRFSEFYDFSACSYWMDFLEVPEDERKEWRMNNLLLFMYAESSGEGV